MVLKELKQCIEMELPNGKVVDILSDVFEEMLKWIQADVKCTESGGFIVGYKHSKTGNITLENISHPYPMDIKNRINFKIIDPRHKRYLHKAEKRKSYYMGVWHTHPQSVPEPSSVDWNDWYETLKYDKTACEYVFFFIAGTNAVRVWVGDFRHNKITEIFECEKEGDLYKKV